MRISRFMFQIALASLFLLPNLVAAAQGVVPMMPLPVVASAGSGYLPLDNGIQIVSTGYTEPRLERAKQRMLETLKHETGILGTPPETNALPQLVIHTDGPSDPIQQVGEDESYHLSVSPGKISLTAPNPLGTMHGLQTLLQLVHVSPAGFVIDSVTIEDKPRFPWRGLMIDSGRHFIPPSIIRQNLDAMEAAKLNVLHWHVSEDQGFRIESKVFPLLTAQGSDGLFYSQEDVRSIIEYARDRGIRVYPEFDMPSHANSFYIGYPELADGKAPYHLKRKFGEKWGRERKPSEDSSMDPTRESTYEFLDKFVGEMSDLFPDAYFHVGGDSEDAVTEWGTNAHIQQYIKDHGFKDTKELQVYFTSRLQKIVASHGKTMIGWDEVLTPTIPKDVVIQSWRGLDSLALSTASGHRGILSWGYYLDLNEPASRHFSVDPFDKPLTPEQQANVLGGETAMWTEYVTPETIEGRIWPRAAAVAERLWSSQSDKDVDSMYRRLDVFSQHLAYIGLPYEATRQTMYRRMIGASDAGPLEVLASVVEPPKGFPREGDRQYNVYTPLNHLSDAVPAESNTARQFLAVANRIAEGKAGPADFSIARQWLLLWQANDARLQPMLTKSQLTLELVPLSRNLSEVAGIGLTALTAVQTNAPLSEESRNFQLAQLKSLNGPIAELTDMVIPGVEALVLAAKSR